MKTMTASLPKLPLWQARARRAVRVYAAAGTLCFLLPCATAGYNGVFVSATPVGPVVVGNRLQVTLVVQNTGSEGWYNEYNASWMVTETNSIKMSRFKCEIFGPVPPGATVTNTVSIDPLWLETSPGAHDIGLWCWHQNKGNDTGDYRTMIPWYRIVTYTVVAPETARIQSSPASQVVSAGSDVTFTVTASGSPPLSYQWSKNETPLAGRTQSSLSLSNARSSDAGSYSVSVSNAYGTAISEAAVLTIVALDPMGVVFPASQTSTGVSLTVSGGTLSWSVDNPCSTWVTLTPTSGVGSSAVLVSVAAHYGTSNRRCTLTIAGIPFTITQAGRTEPGVVHVDGTYDGSDSDGSPERPYRTVAAGYEAALNGDTICIFGTNYNEAITMSKPLLLQGTNGVVTIGIP